MPATSVVVFRWPWGTEARQRSPRGLRPRRQAIFVVAPISFTKTSFDGTRSATRPDDVFLQSRKSKATFIDYLRIARFDHATKHVFIIPGIVLALMLINRPSTAPDELVLMILTGFVAAILVASANYVINEWLDREFDRFHPEKSQRAAVQRQMSPGIVFTEYAAFLILGLLVAAQVNVTFLVASALLALSGISYNVRPLRTKDRVYLDVLSESLNNPLRLLLGWAMIDATTLPPGSLLLSFWFGGAFLMNCKRLAEYHDIVADSGIQILGRYRRSFRFYTEQSLSVANPCLRPSDILLYRRLSGKVQNRVRHYVSVYRPSVLCIL